MSMVSKMLQAANKLGITPKELADDNAKNFRDTQLALGSTFDRFIRTTDEDHYEASQSDLAQARRSRRHLPRYLRRLVLRPR